MKLFRLFLSVSLIVVSTSLFAQAGQPVPPIPTLIINITNNTTNTISTKQWNLYGGSCPSPFNGSNFDSIPAGSAATVTSGLNATRCTVKHQKNGLSFKAVYKSVAGTCTLNVNTYHDWSIANFDGTDCELNYASESRILHTVDSDGNPITTVNIILTDK